MKLKNYEEPKTPAERAIAIFGGMSPLGKAIGRNRSSVCRWTKSRQNGGTDGRIPTSIQGVLLEAARVRGLKLTAEDLVS